MNSHPNHHVWSGSNISIEIALKNERVHTNHQDGTVDIRGAAAVGSIAEDQPTALDLGIAVRGGAFDRTDGIAYAPPGQELIWFATRLYRALSRLGTALAIDLDAYYLPLQSPAG